MTLRYLTAYGLDFSHVQLNNSAEHYSPFMDGSGNKAARILS